MSKQFSEEIRIKMSKSHTGLHHSEETKRKISEKNKGKIVTQETRVKLSLLMKDNQRAKGRVNSENRRKELSLLAKNNGFFREYNKTEKHGKEASKSNRTRTISEETCQKISDRLKGVKRSEAFKQNLKIKLKGNKNALGSKRTQEQKLKLAQKFKFKSTSIELKLQNMLFNENIEFTIHKPILVGKYLTFPDIFIEPNICIYADGDYWHNRPDSILWDKKVNSFLRNHGYKVLRFWEHEINNNLELCLKKIKETLTEG